MHEIRYGVSMARDAGVPVEVVDPARIGELWPAAVDGRPRRRRAVPHGRHGQPGLGGAGAREGGGRSRACATSRTPTVTGFRRGAGRPSRDRDRYRRRRRARRRGRRPGRRPVDLRAGPAGRRERRALPGRARVGHDRRDAGGHGRPAVPPRPRRLPVRPPLPRAVRHRCLRAERQADARRRASRPTASSSSGRTGITSPRCSRQPAGASPPSSRSASRTTCGRRRASRPTRTSSSGSCRRCQGCSSRPA